MSYMQNWGTTNACVLKVQKCILKPIVKYPNFILPLKVITFITFKGNKAYIIYIASENLNPIS